jgi:hypothetical protein
MLFDSPDIAKSGWEVGGDGAAEEIDLFEGGHFACSDGFQIFFVFSCVVVELNESISRVVLGPMS